MIAVDEEFQDRLEKIYTGSMKTPDDGIKLAMGSLRMRLLIQDFPERRDEIIKSLPIVELEDGSLSPTFTHVDALAITYADLPDQWDVAIDEFDVEEHVEGVKEVRDNDVGKGTTYNNIMWLMMLDYQCMKRPSWTYKLLEAARIPLL